MSKPTPPLIISYKSLIYSNLQIFNSARFRVEILACLNIINKIKLKTMEKMNYIAPEVEIIEVAIEQGFAQSNGNGGTYDGFGSEKDLW